MDEFVFDLAHSIRNLSKLRFIDPWREIQSITCKIDINPSYIRKVKTGVLNKIIFKIEKKKNKIHVERRNFAVRNIDRFSKYQRNCTRILGELGHTECLVDILVSLVYTGRTYGNKLAYSYETRIRESGSVATIFSFDL